MLTPFQRSSTGFSSCVCLSIKRYSTIRPPRLGGVSRFAQKKQETSKASAEVVGSVKTAVKSQQAPNTSGFLSKRKPHDSRSQNTGSSRDNRNTNSNRENSRNTNSNRENSRNVDGNSRNDQRVQNSPVESNTPARKLTQKEKREMEVAKQMTDEFARKQRREEKKAEEKRKKLEGKPITEIKKVSLAIPSHTTVANLGNIMNVRLPTLLTKLQELGFEDMHSNHILDNETAVLIADEFDFEVVVNDDLGADLFPAPENEDKLLPRAPIVTIMGHVDHGKTTILDYLRKSSIVNQEFGGITQHIGAFSVITPESKKQITFLDTPGHAAFLKMRQRGANVTDIVVLVVAADDSVMPQTKEAIKHSKNAGVPIIVAINKCDKPEANPDKVLADLAANDIDIEDYGGDTQTVRVSGKTGLNMDKLEEAIITLSETMELKGEKDGIPAEAHIIESEVKKGLGNVATVLVRRGTVKTGTILVAGNTYCKVRIMKDELNRAIKTAGPSTPLEITGWKELPEAGEMVLEAKNEGFAKKVIDNRIGRVKRMQEVKEIELINKHRKDQIEEVERQKQQQELIRLGLDPDEALSGESEEQQTKIINFIIKSDVSGSSEAIRESIDNMGNEEVQSKVLYEDVGPPSETDIERAHVSNSTILAFNLKIPKNIADIAEKKGVKIINHNIIYRLIEEVTSILSSNLKPRIEIKYHSEVQVNQEFKISTKTKKKLSIAGCKVLDGTMKRNSNIMVFRGELMVYKGKLFTMKREKDDVSEVKKGWECGLSFDNWEEFQPGDIVKSYEEISHERFL